MAKVPGRAISLKRFISDRERLRGMLQDCETGGFAHLDDNERDLIVAGIKSRLAALNDIILHLSTL